MITSQMRRMFAWVVIPILGALLISNLAVSQQPPRNDLIAFATYNILLLDVEDGTSIKLTQANQPATHPSWAPDGTQLAFDAVANLGTATANREVFVIEVESGEIEQLTNGTDSPSQSPAWSPTGDQIAYHSYNDGWGIFLMNADGTQQRQIADISSDSLGRMTWSPDGQKIAFVANETSLVVLSISAHSEESSVVSVTDNIDVCESLDWYEDPVWNPSANQIAVIIRCGTQADIYLLDLNSPRTGVTNYVNLTDGELNGLGAVSWLTWSPDGDRLAFVLHPHNQPDYMEVFALSIEETVETETLQITQISQPRSQIYYQHLAWQPPN